MSLNYPNCGAHLTVAIAEDSTATTAAAAVKKAGSDHVNPTNADLQRLKQIMCFPLSTSLRWKPTQPTMGPVVSDKEDEVGILKDCRARQNLDREQIDWNASYRLMPTSSFRDSFDTESFGIRCS
jgi:hypothetical protein